MAGSGRDKPKWARYQIVGGFLCFFLGIALFIVQAVDRLVWGTELDFGALPWGLTVLSIYVLFGVSLPELLGRGGHDDRDEDDA